MSLGSHSFSTTALSTANKDMVEVYRALRSLLNAEVLILCWTGLGFERKTCIFEANTKNIWSHPYLAKVFYAYIICLRAITKKSLKNKRKIMNKYCLWVPRYLKVLLSLNQAPAFLFAEGPGRLSVLHQQKNNCLYCTSTGLWDLRLPLNWKHHPYTACSQLKYHISALCDTQTGSQHQPCKQFMETSKFLFPVVLGDLSNKEKRGKHIIFIV